MMRRALTVIIGILLAGAWIFALFFPLAVPVITVNESYECAWEDGTVSTIGYTDALRGLKGLSPQNNLIIEREGLRGEITTGESFLIALEQFNSTSLAELLFLSSEGLTQIERIAFYRYGEKFLWVEGGDTFAFTGEGVTRTLRKRAEEIILLKGGIPAGNLRISRATTLTLCNLASLTADMLVGSSVERVIAQPPYFVSNGLIYWETAGSVRLVAGLPNAGELYIDDVDFIDSGALAPCTALHTLSLPFIGNMENVNATSHHGGLDYLFSAQSEHSVPLTLTHLQVRGGIIDSLALYGCDSLREIEVCGVLSVAADAFLSCPVLEKVHAPNLSLKLQGEFARSILSCGCTLYERTDEIRGEA